MTGEMVFVLALVVLAVILFATEKLPIDIAALIVMAILLLTGIISIQEGIAGFSHPATVTVGSMFILSAGLYRTGAVEFIGKKLVSVGKKNFWFALVILMVTAGFFSAFINDTAVVAIFLPIVLNLAEELKVSPTKLLMPLSFSALFGGVCTLIGTSTNIIVSSMAVKYGQPPFTMFEFSHFGLIILSVGTLYMLLIGVRLLPKGEVEEDLRKLFGIGDYLIEIVVLPEAKSIGKAISESPLLQDIDIRKVEVFRFGELLDEPPDKVVLQAGDHLKVRCSLDSFRKLHERQGITLRHGKNHEEITDESVFVEAVVAPGSTLDGRTLIQARFRSRYGLTALAIRHRGLSMREHLENIVLQAGDVLLFKVERNHLDQLREDKTFVLVSEVDYPTFRKRKLLISVSIITFVVGSAALGLLPILVSAVIGCILMVLTRCITSKEAYESVRWDVIFLLAGVLALGKAMEKSGAAQLIAHFTVHTAGVWGPYALVSAFYLLTSLLTQLMSNNATAALLVPIVIATSNSLGVDARPFLMAVAFAASAAFMTPVGYQTNAMVYSLGHYRYADFLRVGTPLNLLFWILATIFIPRFWPF
jgi:di/tricarboxylate transporter